MQYLGDRAIIRDKNATERSSYQGNVFVHCALLIPTMPWERVTWWLNGHFWIQLDSFLTFWYEVSGTWSSGQGVRLVIRTSWIRYPSRTTSLVTLGKSICFWLHLIVLHVLLVLWIHIDISFTMTRYLLGVAYMYNFKVQINPSTKLKHTHWQK
jgi:hypothetical protein